MNSRDKVANPRFTTLPCEGELGGPLEWEDLPDAQDCWIARYLNDVDPADKADWPKQQEWLAKRLNEMHRVFRPAREGVRSGLMQAWPEPDQAAGVQPVEQRMQYASCIVAEMWWARATASGAAQAAFTVCAFSPAAVASAG